MEAMSTMQFLDGLSGLHLTETNRTHLLNLPSLRTVSEAPRRRKDCGRNVSDLGSSSMDRWWGHQRLLPRHEACLDVLVERIGSSPEHGEYAAPRNDGEADGARE
mmetsp:Transcript_28969/g.37397  ORF Transcript_28969/g.37397 Transcript_28969/m.37397 type:complete len:105 (+) Transcript_28969:693-1007(+)